MIDRKKAERPIARLWDYDRCNDNDVDEAACMLDALLAEVERLKNYAEHPSSFTDISPTEADAAADTIADLLAERDALKVRLSDVIVKCADTTNAMLDKTRAERDSFEALWRSTMDVLEAERKEREAMAREIEQLRLTVDRMTR